MQNPGRADERNEAFNEKFNKELLLKHLVSAQAPVVFDVGAHKGESVSYFLDIFPQASIYSFEPDPDSFQALVAATQGKNVSCSNMAISGADGLATFYRNAISHTNSLLKVNFSSHDSIKLAEAREKQDQSFYDNFNEALQVPARTLKSFVQEQGLERIDLLKIDVQGAEEQVLVGCGDFLRRIGVIVMEICFFDYYEHSTSFFDVERHLLPHGHKLYSISTISNNPMNGRTDWVDVIYLNSAFQV